MHVMLIKEWNHYNHVGLLFCFNYVQVLCHFCFVVFGYIILSAKRSRLHGKDEKQSLEEVVKGAGGRCAEVKTDDSESLIVLTPAHRSSKFWW